MITEIKAIFIPILMMCPAYPSINTSDMDYVDKAFANQYMSEYRANDCIAKNVKLDDTRSYHHNKKDNNFFRNKQIFAYDTKEACLVSIGTLPKILDDIHVNAYRMLHENPDMFWVCTKMNIKVSPEL